MLITTKTYVIPSQSQLQELNKLRMIAVGRSGSSQFVTVLVWLRNYRRVADCRPTGSRLPSLIHQFCDP
jgi:hypothetical protein